MITLKPIPIHYKQSWPKMWELFPADKDMFYFDNLTTRVTSAKGCNQLQDESMKQKLVTVYKASHSEHIYSYKQ